jgi:hypothetical protein
MEQKISKIDILLINMVSALWQWQRQWQRQHQRTGECSTYIKFSEMQQLFCVLFSGCAFGGIPKREEKWAFYSRYKYKYANTQIK